MHISSPRRRKYYSHELISAPPRGLIDRSLDAMAEVFRTDRWRTLFRFKLSGVRSPVTLAKRLQLAVHTLPPLPTWQKVGGYDESHVEHFTSKLDRIRFAYRKTPCLLVTSAVHGEGKSTLAAQLAARSGSDGVSTLLVDADFRRSVQSTLLDAPEGPGLQEWLKGEAELDQAIIPVCGGGFSLLRAGKRLTDNIGLLPDAKMKALMEQLRKQYDLILIDAPPICSSTFALTLCEHVDLVILSVMSGESRYPLVAQAKRKLAGAAAVGVILNGCDRDDVD